MPDGSAIKTTGARSVLFVGAMAILVLGIGFAVVQSGAVEALNISGLLRE